MNPDDQNLWRWTLVMVDLERVEELDDVCRGADVAEQQLGQLVTGQVTLNTGGSSTFHLGSTTFQLGPTTFQLGSSTFQPGSTTIQLGPKIFKLGPTTFDIKIRHF